MPAFENRVHANPKYNYLGGDQKECATKANIAIKSIRETIIKQSVTGWLKGKIDYERMLKLKEQIEQGKQED